MNIKFIKYSLLVVGLFSLVVACHAQDEKVSKPITLYPESVVCARGKAPLLYPTYITTNEAHAAEITALRNQLFDIIADEMDRRWSKGTFDYDQAQMRKKSVYVPGGGVVLKDEHTSFLIPWPQSTDGKYMGSLGKELNDRMKCVLNGTLLPEVFEYDLIFKYYTGSAAGKEKAESLKQQINDLLHKKD